MPDDEKQLLRLAVENSLAAKAAWQAMAAMAARKGPVTKRLVLDALFAAQTSLDFEAVVNAGLESGDISGRARDQIRQFRDSLADIAPPAPSASLFRKKAIPEQPEVSQANREPARGRDRS